MSATEITSPDPNPSEFGKNSAFFTTHWSLVLAVAQDIASGEVALERLCRNYWQPVYAFIRRRDSSPSDAEDLTQSFFVHLLAKDGLTKVDRQKGKFRSFLLAAQTHFLTNEWAKSQTLKRGGDRQIVFFDDDIGGALYLRESADALSPESL